jgi:hypothetical protein
MGCSYHKDTNLIKYETDPSTDMHKDVASELFFLPKDQVTKEMRQAAKNQFVFPQFYGAWWMQCAKGVWDYIRNFKLDGVSAYEHLRKYGIKRLGDQNEENPHAAKGTFEKHCQKIEKSLWEDRFPEYTQWKKDWYGEYLRKGWFLTKTGFICQGFMSRNEVNNFPIQGDASHCVLWALPRLHSRFKKEGMKVLTINEVHDSILFDCPVEEAEDLKGICQEIMCEELNKEWNWMVLPLKCDFEMSPIDGSWCEKSED